MMFNSLAYPLIHQGRENLVKPTIHFQARCSVPFTEIKMYYASSVSLKEFE